MPRADIVVLNDMHPDDFPGAASIAYSHSKYLSTKFFVSFWHTTLSPGRVTKDQHLEVRSIHRNEFLDKFLRKYMVTRLLSEFASLLLLLKITFLFVAQRPKIVWINQIGVRIPRTISLMLFLLRIRVVQTFHDFGVISPRKLYPKNISANNLVKLSDNKIIDIIYSFRRSLLIFLANRNYQNICISEMQAKIYKSVSVRNLTIISNGIEDCNCPDHILKAEKKNEILFAGRSTGKGFERICRIVKNNPGWTLLAAGDMDLEKSAKQILNLTQFMYLGFLDRSEIFPYIHRVKFVSVISECYDVYPTVALEGLMHKSKVLTTESTGIANSLAILGGGHVLDPINSDINLTDLYNSCSNQKNYPLSLITIDSSSDRYISIFLSAINPAI
jgi:hypothetical protein